MRKTYKIGEKQAFASLSEEHELTNLITKTSNFIKRGTTVQQSDIDKINSILVTNIQKLAFSKLINKSESNYDDLGYFSFEVLSSPSLCETLIKSIEFEKIKDNPDINLEVKERIKPSEWMLSLLISENENENYAYLNGEKINEWDYMFYLKILDIANHFGIDENIDIKRLKDIKLNHLEIWNSYSLDTTDSYLGKSFEYIIKGSAEDRERLIKEKLFKKRTEKLAEQPKTEHPTLWKTTITSIRRLLRFH